MMMDKSAVIGGVRLHYLDREGEARPVVFLHGLSANAHWFDHITEVALTPRFRVLALDLRARGFSDKPATGHSIEEHIDPFGSEGTMPRKRRSRRPDLFPIAVPSLSVGITSRCCLGRAP